MPVRDGASCPGCGLANHEGLCPWCRGDEQQFIEMFGENPNYGPGNPDWEHDRDKDIRDA